MIAYVPKISVTFLKVVIALGAVNSELGRWVPNAVQSARSRGTYNSRSNEPCKDTLSPRPRGYKTFFMLNSTEHEISTAYKN